MEINYKEIIWKKNNEKIFCQQKPITTDGGSNMVLRVKSLLGNHSRIPCMAHLINSIIDNTLKNNNGFATIADKIKDIVTFFKQSVKSVSASDELKSDQEANGKKVKF